MNNYVCSVATDEPVDDELFHKCVIKSRRGSSIRCCLGLWAVHALDSRTAEYEAKHYWIQYYMDGEYVEYLSKPR